MIDLTALEAHRDRSADARSFFGDMPEAIGGRFFFRSPFDPQVTLLVIATADAGWDHVSVSARRRCPTWNEMDWVKRRFFLPDETAMQLHVPSVDHVNIHPHCLHLWRPWVLDIPRPPRAMV